MKLPAEHTSVLIVGAGPSGLMMAAQLLRNGVQPVIIDSRKGPTDQSKALAIQARSLEIFRQMGLVDKIIPEGKPAKGVAFNEQGKQVAKLDLTNIGDPQTLYPYILMYPQSKTERLLLDNLTLNCCPVYWDTTLVSFHQNENDTDVYLKSDEDIIHLTCNWLIGADGANSAVRKQLAIPFKGDTYQHQYYLADVDIDTKDEAMVQINLADVGFTAIFPMPDAQRYRIVGSLPAELLEKQELIIDDIKPQLNKVTGADIKITQTHWFTTYRLHHRMADEFRVQRNFLIGDAAHIHSPVGGQGMNTGLQDAYNLAWKLAGVINGQYNPAILNSYSDERMPVAKDLLKTTDRAFTFILSESIFSRVLKKWLLPFALKKLWGSEKLRRAFFMKVSQTNISYPDSKINLHLSPATKIIAGERLPYLKVYDEKKQTETDLHEWCSKPGFTLITMGKLSEDELFRLARWITKHYPSNLNFFYLPPTNKNRHIFDAFEIGASQQKTLIVRPDMYLGFVNDSVDMVKIDNYLVNVVGVVKSV